MATQVRLSRERWIEAALEALTEGGVAAVAVEPLAARLGVTKGSFYWHFRDRDELLEAALEEWESERTEALTARLDEIDDPRERLEAWGRHAFAADKSLLVALHAAVDHPLVAPVLRRVTERRIQYLADLLRAAGVAPADARRRAHLLYAVDIGLFEIGRALGGRPPSSRQVRALIRDVREAFLRQ